MALKLVRSEEDASLQPVGVTPEQRALYEEAHRIFGDSGANRPDAPGQPVAAQSWSKLSRVRFNNIRTSWAYNQVAVLAPKYRDEFIQRHGLDPALCNGGDSLKLSE